MLLFLIGYGHWKAWDEEPVQALSTTETTKEVEEVVEVNPEETIIYTFEMTKQSLVEKVNALVGNYDISRAVVEECTTQVPDNYKQCIESVIGVANAESTLFTKGMKPSNNPFGLMLNWKKRKFSSVEEAINVWVALYVKNNWGKRTTGQARLNWNYCASECKYRVKNYTSAVKKLALD